MIFNRQSFIPVSCGRGLGDNTGLAKNVVEQVNLCSHQTSYAVSVRRDNRLIMN